MLTPAIALLAMEADVDRRFSQYENGLQFAWLNASWQKLERVPRWQEIKPVRGSRGRPDWVKPTPEKVLAKVAQFVALAGGADNRKVNKPV